MMEVLASDCKNHFLPLNKLELFTGSKTSTFSTLSLCVLQTNQTNNSVIHTKFTIFSLMYVICEVIFVALIFCKSRLICWCCVIKQKKTDLKHYKQYTSHYTKKTLNKKARRFGDKQYSSFSAIFHTIHINNYNFQTDNVKGEKLLWGERLLYSSFSPRGEKPLYSHFSGGKNYYGGKTTI